MKRIALTIVASFWLAGSAYGQRETILVTDNEPKSVNHASLAYRIVNNEVRTEHVISFARGGADILPASTPALNTIKNYLGEKSYITLLRVEGHVSCGGGAQALSEARAKAVSDWLVSHGVDCKRVLPVGFGCTKPITDEHNEANARITFVNAALRGRPVGGMPSDGGGKVAGDACAR